VPEKRGKAGGQVLISKQKACKTPSQQRLVQIARPSKIEGKVFDGKVKPASCGNKEHGHRRIKTAVDDTKMAR